MKLNCRFKHTWDTNIKCTSDRLISEDVNWVDLNGPG